MEYWRWSSLEVNFVVFVLAGVRVVYKLMIVADLEGNKEFLWETHDLKAQLAQGSHVGKKEVPGPHVAEPRPER